MLDKDTCKVTVTTSLWLTTFFKPCNCDCEPSETAECQFGRSYLFKFYGMKSLRRHSGNILICHVILSTMNTVRLSTIFPCYNCWVDCAVFSDRAVCGRLITHFWNLLNIINFNRIILTALMTSGLLGLFSLKNTLASIIRSIFLRYCSKSSLGLSLTKQLTEKETLSKT